MSKMFDRAVEEIRKLPEHRQDDAAKLLLAIVGQDTAGYRLTPEQIEGVKKGLAEAEAGDYVANADVARWLASWGSEAELPAPTSRRRET